MPIARAAAEMEPVSPMRSMSSALPGPMAGPPLPRTRSVRPRYRFIARSIRLRVGKEELLAVDLVVGNGALSFRRKDPVDECLPPFLLHVRVPFRIDEDDAVLVEQAPVALNGNRQVCPILKRKPGAAVGEDVRVHRGGGIECRPHALARVAIPRALILRDIDAGRLPELELGEVRAAAVAARDKGRLGLAYLLEGLDDVLGARHFRR